MEDQISIYEEIGRQSMVLFPHHPFGDACLLSFSQFEEDVPAFRLAMSTQVFDIMFMLMAVYVIENFYNIRRALFKKKVPPKKY